MICETVSLCGKFATAAAAAALIEEKAGSLLKKSGTSRRCRVVANLNIEHRDSEDEKTGFRV